MKLKLFDNPKPVVFAIMAVVGMFLLYKCSDAHAGEIEFGPTFTGEFNGGVHISYSERVRVDGAAIDLGLTLIGEQDFKGETIGNNGNVWVSFVAEKPDGWWGILPGEISIGAAYWINKDSRLIGDELGYQLGVRWLLPEDWPRWAPDAIGVRHWSNAGTAKPNRGQDVLALGWRF